jgi:hypothetical protein
MGVSIIVPTNKSPSEIEVLMSELRKYSDAKNIISTCMRLSAAKNRNIGLDWAKSEIVIQCDDDIEGFYKGWDTDLVAPLKSDKTICFISARLTDRYGKPTFLMEQNNDMVSDLVEVKFTPSACCAFRPRGIRFDEIFAGSGFEDSDAIMQLKKRDPGGRVVINNRCKMIHRNEMKNQQINFKHNSAHFVRKWGFYP